MLRTRVALVVLVILSAVPQMAEATCVGTRLQFSPDPPGPPSIDRTPAIQLAIDQAAAGHPSYPNRTVVIPLGRWLVSGALTLKKGVTLCGATNGPFEQTVDPADTTAGPPWAATLLITHTTAPDSPFINVPSGPEGGSINAAVTDLLFHYPCQRRPDCSGPPPPMCDPLPPTCEPKVYPDTIRVAVPARVERCTVTNAYRFLDIQVGRVTARDLNIGAFMVSINVDNALDRVTLSHLNIGPWWDYSPYTHPVPAPSMDHWVRNNAYAFVIQRADSLAIDNVLVLNRYSAFYFTASVSGAAFGVGTHINIDGCKYCVEAQFTNGFIFSNLFIYGGDADDPIFGAAEWGVWPLQDNSPAGPIMAIHGGVIVGDFNQGTFDVSNPLWSPGKLFVRHVIGYDDVLP